MLCAARAMVRREGARKKEQKRKGEFGVRWRLAAHLLLGLNEFKRETGCFKCHMVMDFLCHHHHKKKILNVF